MGFDRADGKRALGTLVRDLVEEGVSLVRSEAQLAKLEVSRAASAIGRGTVFMALGSVFALLGVLALVIGVILVIGDQWLPADRYWLAALIVVGVTALMAAILAQRGMARMKLTRLGPAETATSVKENARWVKQQLTSVGTSK